MTPTTVDTLSYQDSSYPESTVIILLSCDLWKPAFMTFRTFDVKIIWKIPKTKTIDMFIYCLKPYSGG